MTETDDLDADLVMLKTGLVELARAARKLAERCDEVRADDAAVDNLYDVIGVLNGAIVLVNDVITSPASRAVDLDAS
ncbi:hypothetical protein AXA44_29660 [Rhodococcus sp. SC4]|nr:hypothetical protein AXA44_29660 [Rhodococcus sp. SC4]